MTVNGYNISWGVDLIIYAGLLVYIVNQDLKRKKEILELKVKLNEVIKDINVFIHDFKKSFIITSPNSITTEDIADVMFFLEKKDIEKKTESKVKLKCDICTHEWFRVIPKSNRIICPNCKQNTEYEIIDNKNDYR